jgi:acetyltransferase
MSLFCWTPDRSAASPRDCAWRIRRVHCGDAAAMQHFVDGLGAAQRRWRFHGVVKAGPALVAVLVAGDAVWGAFRGETLIGEARFVPDHADPARAELAIAVADGWQGRGVAAALLGTLRSDARRAGVRVLRAAVMGDNARMQRFLQRHGFSPRLHWEGRGEVDVFECRLAATSPWQRAAARLRAALAWRRTAPLAA